MSKKILEIVIKKIETVDTTINAFSDSLISNVTMINFESHISYGFFLIASGIICLVTLVISLFYVKLSLQPKMKKVKTNLKKETAKNASLQGGSYKYALLSVKRGGIRSTFPVVLTVLSISLLFVFQSIIGNYEDLMNEMTEEYVLTGHMTDLRGISKYHLFFSGFTYNNITDCEEISNLYFEQNSSYTFVTNDPAFHQQTELSRLPSNTVKLASLAGKKNKKSYLYVVNDLEHCSSFYQRSIPEIKGSYTRNCYT